MSALPLPLPEFSRRKLPDYLPARMVNEFTYCPRLFYLEWVDGVFQDSADTIEGRVQHKRVDSKASPLPEPEELTAETIHSRSVTLTSESLRVVAKMDLVEAAQSAVTPVDYKHGRPRETPGGLDLWPADRVQLGLQMLILRQNGYQCEDGIAYYVKTRQRVRLVFTDQLQREIENAVAEAWQTAASGELPPPLLDSPKCPGCSLVGICLPDEMNFLTSLDSASDTRQLSLFEVSPPRKPVQSEIRQLVTPRDELRPVYLNTQGLRIGKSGDVLQVKEKETVVQQIRMGEICQVNLMGNIQITTQAVQSLCEAGIPISYFSQGGWFYGVTTGMNTKNIFLRQLQFRLAEAPWFCVPLAAQLVSGKIRNQRTLLLRNHIEPDPRSMADLKRLAEDAERAKNLEELLGIEGFAARIYFRHFPGLLKTGEQDHSPDASSAGFTFDMDGRNRRPPRDPVNALLSLAYSVLAKDLTVTCYAVGFDPLMGFYHQPRFGRPSLALDLMEPFRPLIADSAVISAINNGMITARDFVRVGPSVALTPAGRKAFFHAYELRMDSLVTHPLFNYRVSYRRLLEIQARLLGRLLEGEIGKYPVFVTR